MAKLKLTNWDFCQAAKKLKCEVAAIKAVATTESRGDGFYDDGFPVILFERHKFRKYTHGKYDQSHPYLSNAKAGGYGKAGQNQRNKFNEAFALDPEAAMMACSWGEFQVMGFNWDDLDYESIHEFVDAMKSGSAAQLDAFVRFVVKNGLKDELQRKDWRTFARVYNGPEFEKNDYDGKMGRAYKEFSKEKIDCASLDAPESDSAITAPAPPPDQPATAKLEDEKNDSTSESTDPGLLNNPGEPPTQTAGIIVNQADAPPPPETTTVEIEKEAPPKADESPVKGIQASIATAVAFIGSVFGGIGSMLAGAKTELIYGFFGAAAIIGVVYIWKRFSYAAKMEAIKAAALEADKQRAHELLMAQIKSASDPNLNTVKIV